MSNALPEHLAQAIRDRINAIRQTPAAAQSWVPSGRQRVERQPLEPRPEASPS